MFGLAPGIDGGEIIVILVVALIVVGPKDLPGLIRRVGKFLGRMRAMAGDFRASFDEMARQSELDELRAEIQSMKGVNTYGDKLASPAAQTFADIDTEMRRPPSSSRPFAPPELSEAAPDDGLNQEPPPATKSPARAPRPFSVAEPDESAADDSPVVESELPPSIPQMAPRPFAPPPVNDAGDPSERRQA